MSCKRIMNGKRGKADKMDELINELTQLRKDVNILAKHDIVYESRLVTAERMMWLGQKANETAAEHHVVPVETEEDEVKHHQKQHQTIEEDLPVSIPNPGVTIEDDPVRQHHNTTQKQRRDLLKPMPSLVSSSSTPPTRTSLTPSSTSGDCQVLLSFHSPEMQPIARRIQYYLEINGIRVKFCNNFQDVIATYAESCSVFIPLINANWCESKKCKHEFDYIFRKNLISDYDTPAIIPILFSDVELNAYNHVRVALANTKAITYVPGEEGDVLQNLKIVLQRTGLTMNSDIPSQWSVKDVSDILCYMLVRKPLEEDLELDGKKLVAMNPQDFENAILNSASFVKETIEQLQQRGMSQKYVLHQIQKQQITSQPIPVEISFTPTTSSSTGGPNFNESLIATSSSVANRPPPFPNPPLTPSYDGMYKIIVRKTECQHGTVSTSNPFLVNLKRNGISSSGCSWDFNSSMLNDDKYDGTTATWQGEYRDDGTFFLSITYSNKAHEEFAGLFERLGGEANENYLFCREKYCKYASFEPEKVDSYGMVDLFLYKLNKSEMRRANHAIQLLALESPTAEPLETIMQNIGPNMKWEDFFRVVDVNPPIDIDPRGFCYIPRYGASLCVGQTIALEFSLPGDVSLENDCLVSIVHAGATEPNYKHYFNVHWFYLARGYAFSKKHVPTKPGSYEIALFNNSEKVAYNPINLVNANIWRELD